MYESTDIYAYGVVRNIRIMANLKYGKYIV